MLEQILSSEEFINFVASLIVILLGFACKYLRENVQNNNVIKAVNTFEKVVNNSVGFVKQTIVDDLKLANADGKLTEEEKKHVKELAVAAINTQLSKESKEILTQIFGDLDIVIDKWIEASVERLKNK